MKVVGRKISNMVSVRKIGRMELTIKVNLKMVRRKALGNLFGRMVIHTKVNSKMIILQGPEPFIGQIKELTLAS